MMDMMKKRMAAMGGEGKQGGEQGQGGERADMMKKRMAGMGDKGGMGGHGGMNHEGKDMSAEGKKQMYMCMIKKAGEDSECAKCLKGSMDDGGDDKKVEFEVSFVDYKKQNDCKKGNDKGKPVEEKDVAYLGCNMQDDNTSMHISCPNQDDTLTLKFFQGTKCEGEAEGEMVMMDGDCSEEKTEGRKPKSYWQAVHFKLPEQCMKPVPEFFKTYDGSYDEFKAYCAESDKDACKSCGGKFKVNKKTKKEACTPPKENKVKCTKLGADLCQVVPGCTYNKKKKKPCSGKAKFD